MHPSNFAAILQCLYATSFSQAMFSSHLHSDVPSAQSFQKSSRSIESGLNAGIEDIAGSPLSISKDILSDAHFASLGRSSDCFRKVAGSIRTHCAELDMNEEDRVVAAISMTLCELATAKHHAPPMECDVFSAHLHEPSYRSGSSARQQVEFEDSRGECVNALSRSAQFWSSYSGYLREIPQLCFTFQRGNDIDHAKKIFQNISLNQDFFLRMVVDREHMNQKHTERLSAVLDDAHGVTDQLSFLAQRIQTEASSAVKEFEEHGSEILELLSRSVSDFWLQMHDNHSVQVTNINSALTGLSKRHSEDLQAIVPELRGVLLQLLTQSHEIARKQEEIILRELTNSVQDQWRVLYSEFSAMQEAISHLTAMTTSNALSISSQFNQTAQNIDQAHALISNSTTQLSDVLDRLAEKTNHQMEVLDVKVEELKEKLIPPSPDENQSWFSYESVTSERWWKGKLVSALGFWIRGVPLSAWANSPFLKILEIIWVITFWLLQRSLSTVTASFYSLLSHPWSVCYIADVKTHAASM